jgi:hypothetical protein
VKKDLQVLVEDVTNSRPAFKACSTVLKAISKYHADESAEDSECKLYYFLVEEYY